MDDQTARFLEQMKQDPAALKRLLSSPEGQSLMQLLSRENQNRDLQQAMQAASSGNTVGAMKLVRRFLKTPDGSALADRISRTFRK